jgi:hypothetical protein
MAGRLGYLSSRTACAGNGYHLRARATVIQSLPREAFIEVFSDARAELRPHGGAQENIHQLSA